jgi:CRP-like cAMP-binding protein
MQDDADLSRALLMAASADLRQLVAHVEELKAMTGPARLAAMILKLSEAQGGARQVTLPYEKQLIAGRLGMTPESFSRAIGQLKAHGVRVSRDRLDIADVGRLREFAYFAR